MVLNLALLDAVRESGSDYNVSQFNDCVAVERDVKITEDQKARLAAHLMSNSRPSPGSAAENGDGKEVLEAETICLSLPNRFVVLSASVQEVVDQTPYPLLLPLSVRSWAAAGFRPIIVLVAHQPEQWRPASAGGWQSRASMAATVWPKCGRRGMRDGLLTGQAFYGNLGLVQSNGHALNLRARKKVAKYRDGYLAPDRRRAFLPAVVSTSGRIHGEPLRVLYILADIKTNQFFSNSGDKDYSHEAFRWRRGEFSWHIRAKLGLACR